MGHSRYRIHPNSCPREHLAISTQGRKPIDSHQNLDSLNLVYGPTTFFVRLSLILFYFRIFATRWSRALKYLTVLILVFQTLFFLIDLAVACSMHSLCVSIASLDDHRCNTISIVVTAQSAASVAMNLLILFIPITLIIQYPITWSRKLPFAALFSTGFMYIESLNTLRGIDEDMIAHVA